MYASLIISFRETLEAALIVGIVLSYLNHIRQFRYHNTVYIGVTAAIVCSIILAFIFEYCTQGFSGTNEKIFEGITMMLASVFLSWMLIWMAQQNNISSDLKAKLQSKVDNEHYFGIFFLIFLAVLREGIETVLFLNAATMNAAGSVITGSLIGISIAILLGYIIFVVLEKISLKKFFRVTTIMLGLFGAGLFAHGIHEFQEAAVLPTFIEHVWDINPAPTLIDDMPHYPAFHEKGAIGVILVDLFGYNGNPSLLELLAYICYSLVIFMLYSTAQKKKH